MKRLAFILQMLVCSFITTAQQTNVDSLRNLITIAKPDTNKVLLLINLSDLYTWRKPDSCIIVGKQGLTLASKLHYYKGVATLKYIMGTASWILGNYYQADKMLLEALKYAESSNDTVLITNLYTSITSNKRDKGDYRDALAYSFKAYQLCKSCDLFKVKIGSIYLEMDMIDSALYYLKSGPAWGYSLWLLGKAYDKRGDSKTAYKYYLQSISDEVANGNSLKDISNVYSSLALLFKKENRIDSCTYYAKKAYNTAHEIYYTKGMWETALLLSTVYEKTNPQEALRYFKIATAAKDSLFNLQKTMHFLNEDFNVQFQKQKDEINKTNFENKIRIYMLLAALGFFLVIAGIQWRNNKQKQKTNTLLQEEKYKVETTLSQLKNTQIKLIESEKEQMRAYHEKELLQLEAKALRAQMNPHFIFNCMNSIKALIQQKEEEKAIIYLTTFSKLIRTIFQNSDKKEISLFDEIETCMLYTQLESMRFGNKLSYNFCIDKVIDLKSVMIPALIMQPFIENAIWHGIMPKEAGGNLTVTLKRENEVIQCIIDDDGIGREISMRNKFKKYPTTHQSKGMYLTQTRIDLDNLLNYRNASIKIIDKKNIEGNAEGTSVVIEFSL
jgi:tetratricopeptide (TPR) repeat protein